MISALATSFSTPGALSVVNDGTAGGSLDPVAIAYVSAHGITAARARNISQFLRGLDTLGLRSNLVDAACYRSDTQPTGATAPSIKGTYDVTLVGAPLRRLNGIEFDGATQYGYSEAATQTGARTLMILQSGITFGTCPLDSAVVAFASNISSYSLRTNFSNKNPNVFSYGGGSVRSVNVTSPTSWTGGTSGLSIISLRDDAAGGASSLSHVNMTSLPWVPPATKPVYAKTYGQGEASHSLNQIRLCVTANNNFSTKYGYANALVAGWLLFDKALTDDEELDVKELLDRTLYPKYVMVWEGDSIDNDLSGGGWYAGKYGRGANMELLHVWDGGQAAANCVTQLGVTAVGNKGFTDANLANGNTLTFAVLGAGTNDFGVDAVTAATIFSRLATCWAYAKERGAIVIARTIIPRYDDDQRLSGFGPLYDKRRELNDLIRAQEGILYDILWDTDQWVMDHSTTIEVIGGKSQKSDWDTTIYRDVDVNGGLHLVVTPGGGANLMADELGAILTARNLI
jgi:hypothetical protein